MPANPLIELQSFGQSVWLDNLRRRLRVREERRADIHEAFLTIGVQPHRLEHAASVIVKGALKSAWIQMVR